METASLSPEQLEAMARTLEASGKYKVLRKVPRFGSQPVPAGTEMATGLMVDVETTGLRADSDVIIELAAVPFRYDRSDGRIYEVLEAFTAFNDPGRRIPREIVALTGITDDDVRGKRIDAGRVAELLEQVDLVVAHNAGFDRPFLERMFPGFAAKPWACTVSDINWSAEGIRGSKLEYLTLSFGYHYQAHRAEDDCMAALMLLAQKMPRSGLPALLGLLESCGRSTWRFQAVGAPFEAKDSLKGRGYRWNPAARFWWKDIADDYKEAEQDWLSAQVYKGGKVPEPKAFSALERYSRRFS